MLTDLRLLSSEFTRREATLAFVWSRMRCVDESSDASRRKLVHLSFEDFLEFLVRVSTMKALPTDAEIAAAGCADAGAFILGLQLFDANRYESFVADHTGRWDKELPQPIDRCVDHLIHLIIKTIEASAAAGSTDGKVSQREFTRFIEQGGALAGSSVSIKARPASAAPDRPDRPKGPSRASSARRQSFAPDASRPPASPQPPNSSQSHLAPDARPDHSRPDHSRLDPRLDSTGGAATGRRPSGSAAPHEGLMGATSPRMGARPQSAIAPRLTEGGSVRKPAVALQLPSARPDSTLPPRSSNDAIIEAGTKAQRPSTSTARAAAK